MKTITFEGEDYQVREWVNFVARDFDGEINGFEFRPALGSIMWRSLQGMVVRVGQSDNLRWFESLTEV